MLEEKNGFKILWTVSLTEASANCAAVVSRDHRRGKLIVSGAMQGLTFILGGRNAGFLFSGGGGGGRVVTGDFMLGIEDSRS